MNKIKSLIKNWLDFNNNFPIRYQRISFRFLVNLDIGRNIRYREMVRIIKKTKMNNPSIIEFGSGKIGITSYLKQKVIGLDVTFDDYMMPFLASIGECYRKIIIIKKQ